QVAVANTAQKAVSRAQQTVGSPEDIAEHALDTKTTTAGKIVDDTARSGKVDIDISDTSGEVAVLQTGDQITSHSAIADEISRCRLTGGCAGRYGFSHIIHDVIDPPQCGANGTKQSRQATKHLHFLL